MNCELTDIRELLDTEAARINHPDFIALDPVQFPRRFTDQRDIEIIALIASSIAWGNRTMICRDMERILTLMDHQPFAYLQEGAYELLDPTTNLHRTFFADHLQWMLRGLRRIYSQHSTLDAFSQSVIDPCDPAPAWALSAAIARICIDESHGATCSRTCLSTQERTTALKRFNMMLRWLVRDDGIVDLGIWRSIDKSKLYLPLDVHVGRISRELGLLERRSNDRRATEQLTANLRTFRPDDPCLYDYALFGIGISQNTKSGN